MMPKTCFTCAHYSQRVVRTVEDEDGPIPIYERFCMGEPIPASYLSFGCGLYKVRE